LLNQESGLFAASIVIQRDKSQENFSIYACQIYPAQVEARESGNMIRISRVLNAAKVSTINIITPIIGSPAMLAMAFENKIAERCIINAASRLGRVGLRA
jgi:hypothetical protein